MGLAPQDDPYEAFPEGFFDRTDSSDDHGFYAEPRLVTHIDDGAIAAVGRTYTSLGIEGRVLDLMSSWISHFEHNPAELTVLGMNQAELGRNTAAHARQVHDLNADPILPYADRSFDHAVCCVSVDYLTRPIEVFREVARVLEPGGRFVCTFSNRCFPTKAIRGWLGTDDATHCAIVARYFEASGVWGATHIEDRSDPDRPGDPLYAVWAEAEPSTN